MPFITGQREGRPHEVLFWRLNQRAALRLGDWKLVRNPRGKAGSDWELYNLADDIGEERDLAALKPAQHKALLAVWQRMNEQMIEPFWKPNP